MTRPTELHRAPTVTLTGRPGPFRAGALESAPAATLTDPPGRPRLVHVTTTAMSLELLLGPQLEAFAAAGYEVIGVSAPDRYVPALAERGVAHVAVPLLTRRVDPRSDLGAARDLFRLFRELRPAIVHTHNPKPGLFGRPLARLAGVPAVVNTVHGLYAQPTDRRRRRWPVFALERAAAAWSHAELVQNPEDVATLESLGVPSGRVALLGNGIDLDRFRPEAGREQRDRLRRTWGVGPDDVVVGFVGRLVAEKGFREVFSAARHLTAARPEVKVVVVGPAEPNKRGALTEAELADARRSGVVLAGAHDDMPAVYAAFDAFGLASHREGFPRSAMEAAACGLPLVVTDIRGGRQVVDHGRNGFLVPRGDARALADALALVAGDLDRRLDMGAASLTKALAEFDQRRVVELTLQTYERLLGLRPASRPRTARAA